MGQDEIYLQVIEQSGEGAERKHAKSVLRLLKRGKHWVLVTLLLSNVITNETLPIVLDRSLGGGWPAVLSSTVLIGECATLLGRAFPRVGGRQLQLRRCWDWDRNWYKGGVADLCVV